MTKISIATLSSKRNGSIIALLMILLFFIIALFRVYYLGNEFDEIINGADDWTRYARNAVDIKQNGLLLSSQNELYFSPNSFLYNYFIALCFMLFGENTTPVYLIQNILLGCSILLIYLSFRDKMKNTTALVFLFTMFAFGLMDISKYYTFRFLSENLVLFTLSAFFYSFHKGIEKHKPYLLLTSAVLLGASSLIRPNILPFVVLFIPLFLYFQKQKKQQKFTLILFILLLAFSATLLGLRNYLVCGQWVFLPTEGTSAFQNILNNPDLTSTMIFKRLIYFGGILSPLEPGNIWRFHWTIMWFGFFAYLFLKFRDKEKFELWELSVLLFIFSYYGLLLVMAEVQSYGFRYLVPVILFVLPFAFIAFDKIRHTENHK